MNEVTPAWPDLTGEERYKIMEAASVYSRPDDAGPEEIASEMFYVVQEVLRDRATDIASGETTADSQRAMQAAQVILDGRDPVKDRPPVLITLDHTIALILLAAMDRNPKKAVQMFNEGTVPHVEERIMLFASKQPR
jgi:hypothetical protein